jgi:hypothetical protein
VVDRLVGRAPGQVGAGRAGLLALVPACRPGRLSPLGTGLPGLDWISRRRTGGVLRVAVQFSFEMGYAIPQRLVLSDLLRQVRLQLDDDRFQLSDALGPGHTAGLPNGARPVVDIARTARLSDLTGYHDTLLTSLTEFGIIGEDAHRSRGDDPCCGADRGVFSRAHSRV